MRKRPAAASPADYNFAKAYFELVRLREEVERIEKLSMSRSGKPTAADCDTAKANRRTRNNEPS